MPEIRYNERSWAIDVITEINNYIFSQQRIIKRAGGESSISSGSKTLFPDVLLFSDQTSASILQGWELKFPNTPITDAELIENASKKADILSINSFLLWNVTSAVLYVKNDNKFVPVHHWNDLYDIRSRTDVEQSRSRWVAQLHNIIDVLNGYFNNETLKPRKFISAFEDQSIIEFILGSTAELSQNLFDIAITDSEFESSVNIWWRSSKKDYLEKKQWDTLASLIIISWYTRIIFAHISKQYFDSAQMVEEIKNDTTIDRAIEIFDSITESCNFYQIYKVQLGGKFLTTNIWNQMLELNILLSDLNLGEIEQSFLQQMLESLVKVNRRKTAGQYITPSRLADFLIRLTVVNKHGTVYDPCCGTGTIPNRVYNYKIESGISHHDAIDSLYLSDKFSFPLQIASLAITNPENIGIPVKLFRTDITELSFNDEIEIHDPNNGDNIIFNFPKIKYIISNLPFVQQEDIEILNPNITHINDEIKTLTETELEIDDRSDLYSYLPFYLHKILADDGTLSIIISNSWLATEMGKKFRNILRYFYTIKYVVVSAKNRWFNNAKVVTSILVLNKKNTILAPFDESIKFISLNHSINDESTNIQEIVDHIITNNSSNSFNLSEYSTEDIEFFESMGLEWTSLFTNLDWITQIASKLIPVNELFQIRRGERRGKDALFYPKNDHGIEDNYLKLVLKSPDEVTHLITEPTSDAFCCSKTKVELEELGHTGALSWISRFEYQVNQTGRPLPIVLSRTNMHWYEMNDTTTADFVTPLNPDKRLYFAKLHERSFVNQRFIRLKVVNDSINVDLVFALLNSITSIFYIEALGFGRGLGVLDLSATRLKDNMKILDPNLLSPEEILRILTAFQPLKERLILDIEDELNSTDRLNFETVVLESFQIHEYKDRIINAFQTLYKIRKSVND